MRRGTDRIFALIVVVAGLAAGAARAQAVPATLNPTFVAPPASADIVLMDQAPTEPAFAPPPPGLGIHGDISTGIATHGGRMVSGDVLVPVMPGVALEVGGGTGQEGLFVPGEGKHTATARYSTYHAALHVQATNDVQVNVAVSGTNLKLPAYAP